MRSEGRVAAALFLAIGLGVSGWFVGQGFVNGRTADRFVTVKGLSEREVSADIALWPLRFVAASDNLSQAQRQIEADKQTVIAFLERQGIASKQIEVQGLQVTDQAANPYRSGPYTSRFIIAQTLMVRTERPELVQMATQKVSELVAAGVVLSTEGGYGGGPTYLFTGLSDLKPEMIAEATANARRGAEQFAKDSGGHLGGMRRANQGVFVIQARDQAPGIAEQSQMQKTVRVVSTIEYYLTD